MKQEKKSATTFTKHSGAESAQTYFSVEMIIFVLLWLCSDGALLDWSYIADLLNGRENMKYDKERKNPSNETT